MRSDGTIGERMSRLPIASNAKPIAKTETQGKVLPAAPKRREAMKTTIAAFSPTIKTGPR